MRPVHLLLGGVALELPVGDGDEDSVLLLPELAGGEVVGQDLKEKSIVFWKNKLEGRPLCVVH